MEFWPLLAGLGLFMLGMKQLEDALKVLAGESFRRFLRDHADTPLKGLAVGTLATAVLQSSSLVSLLVLAFVGAGIIELRAAVGVIMGANLGTTVTGWLVATLGFKFSLGDFALAFLGFGGLGSVLLPANGRLQPIARFVVGLGLLLFGLDMMKAGVERFAEQFDVSPFAGWPLLALALLGVGVTALIQSSSAAMMIALSALHGGVLGLEAAAAFAVGTGVGTTVTAVLGAVGGSPDKKRVAAAHVGYNLVKAIAALLLLKPLLALLGWLPGLEDPLLRLVAFHSAFNVVGILLMLPFVGPAAGWLSRRFEAADATINRYLAGTSAEVPEAGCRAVGKEVGRVIRLAIGLNRYALRLHPPQGARWVDPSDAEADGRRRSYGERYERLKRLEGELIDYVLELQRRPLEPAQAQFLIRQLEAARSAVASAKAVKDVRQNLVDLRLALRPAVDAWLRRFEQAQRQLYDGIERIDPAWPQARRVEALAALRASMRNFRDEIIAELYHGHRPKLRELELSTLLNVNRELYASSKQLLRALNSHLLEPEAADLIEAATVDA